MQTIFPNRPRRALWLLAAGITLAPLFALPVLAETYPLDSVDFASTNNQTNIILHTGSIVPVQKVLVSNEKLILDIDQIDDSETIRTNFTGASNISHVILQPLSEHKVRMIIRGDHLGAPNLAFYNAGTGAYSATNTSYNGPMADVSDPDPLSPTPTATAQERLSPASVTPATNAQNNAPLSLEKSTPAPAATAPSQPATSGWNPMNLASGLGNAKIATPSKDNATAPEKSPLSLPEMPVKGSDILDAVLASPLTTYLPYGLLGILLLGAGLFVRNKILQLKGAEPELEALLDEQANGRKVSFREMADAYRHKHDQRHDNAPSRSDPVSKPSRKAAADELIGLRGLNQSMGIEAEWDQPPVPRPAPSRPAPRATASPVGNTTPTMEQLVALMQKIQPPKPEPAMAPQTFAPQKQVANQYAQQAGTGKAKPKSREAADQKMYQEMQRAQQIQQELEQQAQQQRNLLNSAGQNAAPVNRAPAAKKNAMPFDFKSAQATNPVNAGKKRPAASNPLAGTRGASSKAAAQQGPLPGNPEVLNFLRNVADLMEKDGKTDIAKNIHKNLSPQNIL